MTNCLNFSRFWLFFYYSQDSANVFSIFSARATNPIWMSSTNRSNAADRPVSVVESVAAFAASPD